MSDDVPPLAHFDPAAEASAIRERSTAALRALRDLSLGAHDPMRALTAIRSLRSRCDHICHQLSLRNLQRPVDAITEPIEREAFPSLMEYVEAVDAASVSLRAQRSGGTACERG